VVGWPACGWGWFSLSLFPARSGGSAVGGSSGWVGWVERKVSQSVRGPSWWGLWGLARCWVLRGHLWVAGWCRWRGVFFLAASGLDCLTHPGGSCVCGAWCGCGGGRWVGVWLCVECCIVDASILLWSSC